MSKAQTLLSNLTDEEISVLTSGNGGEKHIVIDNTRKIFVPDTLKRIAVQYDHNVETVSFDCPRYWNGLDMSEMIVYINYTLPDKTLGSCVANNVRVDDADQSIMHFDWNISRNITAVKGNIAFLVCIKKTDADGNENNHWNSELNRDLYISEGLECVDWVASSQPDLITYLLLRMTSIENIATPEAMQEYVDSYMIDHEPVELDRALTDPLKAAPADLVGKLYNMMSEGAIPDNPTEPSTEIKVFDLVGEKMDIKYHGQAEFSGFLSFVDINDNLSLCGITLSIKPPNGAVNSLTLFIYKNDTLVLEKPYVDLNVTSESDVLFAFDPIQLTTGDVLGYGFTCHRPVGIYLSSITPSISSKYMLINTNTWTDFEPVLAHERIYAQFHSRVLTDISGNITSGGSVWSGKTGNFLGDSITNMGLYTERLSKKGNITVNNYGIGGTTYSDIYDVNQFYTRIDAMSDVCDFIFVFGGTNDWGLSVPLGTVGDTETDTFYGGLNATFSALRTKYPTKPIFVATILQRNLASGLGGQVTGMTSNNHGNSIFDFNDAIKQVAGRYGCVVIDGCAESGIIYENLDVYTSDRLHLNGAGAERFAQFILDKMNHVTPY